MHWQVLYLLSGRMHHQMSEGRAGRLRDWAVYHFVFIVNVDQRRILVLFKHYGHLSCGQVLSDSQPLALSVNSTDSTFHGTSFSWNCRWLRVPRKYVGRVLVAWMNTAILREELIPKYCPRVEFYTLDRYVANVMRAAIKQDNKSQT